GRLRSIAPGEQIRAILARALHCLFFSPFRDFGVISGKQNFGNLPAAKFRGPCILRAFEPRALRAEAIVNSGSFLTKCTRQKSRDWIKENHGSDCAVGEYVIAN